MIRWLILLWLCLPFAAIAAPVAVTSGEHDGFTRLVFDFGHVVDWQVGRTEDGYTLRIKEERPAYDLREAFALIGKSRLAAIWAEPETGALRLGIACACHGIPFEFRPGIVVIDLKDGPPPKGSSFELTLDGSSAADLTQHPQPRPRPRPGTERISTAASYDWIEALPTTGSPPPPPSISTMEDPELLPLRDSLLRQLSHGAAEGVVEMVGPTRAASGDAPKDLPTAQVRIGAQDNAAEEPPLHTDLTAQGAACLPDERLALSDWGDETPVSEQFSTAMAGLIGEFDRPDPIALQRAIQFNLYLGFGAEARQLIRAFKPDLPEVPIWQSLAYLLDEEPDPAPVFAGQSACDGAVALWAILSDPPPGPGDSVNQQAIRRSFSALPLHLRRHLGPRLAERFLALGDEESARAIRDAILRAPGGEGAAVAVMEAELALHTGDPAAAAQQLEAVLADPGPEAGQALVALVHARTAQYLPVSPEVVIALQAHLAERSGTEALPFAEALTLAEAASGDFASAFATADLNPKTAETVWSLLVHLGPDEAVLAQAVLAEDAPVPKLSDPVLLAIGQRLLTLGFPDAARGWLIRMAEPEPLLLAAADMGRGDAQAVVRDLAGRQDTEALLLKAEAFAQIGDQAAASEALHQAGLAEAALIATRHARDWPSVAGTVAAENGADPWQRLAAGLTAEAETGDTPANDPMSGPLTAGHRLVETSATTRSSVTALLATIPAPSTVKQ